MDGWPEREENELRFDVQIRSYGPGGKGFKSYKKIGGEWAAFTGYINTAIGRDPNGHWNSMNQDIKDYHRSAARYIQDYVGDYIGNHLLRPNVSTGTLEKATRHNNNIRWSTDGFAVGREEHLETSGAKYWRTIEEGSQATWHHTFVGMRLTGWFGGTLGTTRSKPVYGAAGPYTAVGKGTGGKFVPANPATWGQAKDEGWGPPGKGVVQNEIEGMHAYPQAYDSWRGYGGGKDSLAVLGKAILRSAAGARRGTIK